MLNRRFLRIKAMQALYAYKQKEASNFNMALEHLSEHFQPDLNSMVKPDLKSLKEKTKRAKRSFEKSFETRKIEETDVEISNAINESFRFYDRSLTEDLRRIKLQMVDDAQLILDHYYSLLLLLTEFSTMNLKRHKTFLDENKLLMQLADDPDFKAQVARRKLYWEKEDSLVKKLFRDYIQPSSEYAEYQQKSERTFVDDKKFVLHLFKNVVDKNEIVDTYFEENDTYWSENKEIVATLIVKTLKSAEDNNVRLMSLSENWEDDKAYYLMLFQETIRLDDELKEILVSKLKNWDIERVAFTDKIILEMALVEMINCTNIPTKVTINEYIEISKNYSTPKSKQFINGMLDTLAKELTLSGKIKKSGRGLIDNK